MAKGVAMIARTDRIHIGLDDAAYEQDFIKATKHGGRFDTWNLVSHAQRGDTVVIYLKEGISAFVGTCVVDSERIPRPADKPSHQQDAWFHVRNARVLPNGYVHRSKALNHFAGKWSYFKRPTVTCIPRRGVSRETVDEFLEFLGLTSTPCVAVGVIEAIKREVTYYLRSRNKTISEAALRASNGVCEACERDFSKVMNGAGWRVLQVHHRKQLALQETPVVTRQEDLAAVCANCHILIHMDSRKALPVEVLCGMLRREPGNTD